MNEPRNRSHMRMIPIPSPEWNELKEHADRFCISRPKLVSIILRNWMDQNWKLEIFDEERKTGGKKEVRAEES